MSGHATRVLRTLAEHGEADIRELQSLTGLNRRQISNAAGILVRRQLAARIARGAWVPTAEGQTAAAAGREIQGGPQAPLRVTRRWPDTLRQRAWRALRINRKATTIDLLISASQGHERGGENNLNRYLNALSKAGYVSRMRHRQPGSTPTSNGFTRWLLIRDTGPLAPIWRREHGTVYDPNSDETIEIG